MFSFVLDLLQSAIFAAWDWLGTISDGVGFDLRGFLLFATIFSIVVAYFLLPAVGGSSGSSDRSSRAKGKSNSLTRSDDD